MRCYAPVYGVDGRGAQGDGTVSVYKRAEQALAKDGEFMELSCGTCKACRTAKKRDWAIRCYHESLMTRDAEGVPIGSFLTLSFNDTHLPHNDYGVEELDPKSLSAF